MELTEETKKEINEIFEKKPQVRDILLLSDEDKKRDIQRMKRCYEEIERIRVFGTSNFSAVEVLECFELDRLDYLYDHAVMKDKYAKIYFGLIGSGANYYTMEDNIGTLFDDDKRTKEELSKVDAETMKNICRYGESGFSAGEVIKYHDTKTMDKLRERAEKKAMFKEVYFETINKPTTSTK